MIRGGGVLLAIVATDCFPHGTFGVWQPNSNPLLDPEGPWHGWINRTAP